MRVLIIDDEPMVKKSLANFISNQLGHEVTACESALEARKLFKSEPFPLIISDILMPGLSGIELTEEIKKNLQNEMTDIILMTGHANLDLAIKAIRAGAFDFLKKPIDIELLALTVEKVIKHQELKKQNQELTTKFDQKVKQECDMLESKFKELQNAYSNIVGIGEIGIYSEKMKQITQLARKLHQNRDIPALLQGETGTGKDIIAQLIHYGDGEPDGPFVTINCSAISETLFESELFGYEGGAFTGSDKKGKIGKLELAQNGTLFLDEIGDMPKNMQPKLLKALQDKEIYRVGGIKKIKLDVRIICATNSDLHQQVQMGEFRSDLYYRINTTNIFIPPLRERKDDIIPLTQLFLKKFSRDHQTPVKFLSNSAAKALKQYNWPGNVRQLQNAVERAAFLHNDRELKSEHFAFLFGDSVAVVEEDPSITIKLPADKFDLYKAQEKIARKALLLHKNNKTQTAKYLGISINKLRRILGEM